MARYWMTRVSFVTSMVLTLGWYANVTIAAPAPKQSKAPTPPQPKGVVAQFAVGMKLYDAGKYTEALVVFDKLHKQYPAHEPTTIQYAKTLYRLERIPESYNLFARINPQYLDPETSYEYGYAFYIQNRFDGALFAFKRVPLDHPLFDLASYYGAMCAIHLKNYAEAEELLDKAVVLPDKLARSKALYQKHVASLRQLQEKSNLDKATADEKKRLADQNNTKQPTTNGKPAPAPAPAPVPLVPATQSTTPLTYVHNGFYGVDRFAKIQYWQENTTQNFHGYSLQTYQSQIGSLILSQGPIFTLPYKLDNSRQAAFGAEIDLSVSSTTIQGTQSVQVAYTDSPDIVHNLTTQTTTTTNTADAGTKIWIETPIPSGWWLGGDGHLGFTYPNFQRGQRYGYRGGTAHVGWRNTAPTSWTVEGQETYDQIVDSNTNLVNTQLITDVSGAVRWPSNTKLKLGSRYAVYTYQQFTILGPDTSAIAYTSATQFFPLNIELTLGGSFEAQQNYVARNMPDFDTASANGQIMTGYAKLKASPLSWLTISAAQTITSATWSVGQSEREAEFKAATPNYTEVTDLLASLNFNF